MPEINLTVPSKGGWFYMFLQESFRNSTAAAPNYQLFVDGVAVGTMTTQSSMIAGANDKSLYLKHLMHLSPGVHKIGAMWRCVGSAVTSFGRQMIVEEL